MRLGEWVPGNDPELEKKKDISLFLFVVSQSLGKVS